jgi:hypothetical protein
MVRRKELSDTVWAAIAPLLLRHTRQISWSLYLTSLLY